jgi:hypothetical protein
MLVHTLMMSIFALIDSMQFTFDCYDLQGSRETASSLPRAFKLYLFLFLSSSKWPNWLVFSCPVGVFYLHFNSNIKDL